MKKIKKTFLKIGIAVTLLFLLVIIVMIIMIPSLLAVHTDNDLWLLIYIPILIIGIWSLTSDIYKTIFK